jgi:hypothetical protein
MQFGAAFPGVEKFFHSELAKNRMLNDGRQKPAGNKMELTALTFSTECKNIYADKATLQEEFSTKS